MSTSSTNTGDMNHKSGTTQAALKLGASLVASGVPIPTAARAVGISEGALRKHLKQLEEHAIERGFGGTQIAATAHLLLRTVLARLEERYGVPDGFGDIEDDKALREAIRVLSRLTRIPAHADERITKLVRTSMEFLIRAVSEREDIPPKILLQALAAVAPLAQDIVEAKEDSVVVAETVVKRRVVKSQPEPTMTERARRILPEVLRAHGYPPPEHDAEEGGSDQ